MDYVLIATSLLSIVSIVARLIPTPEAKEVDNTALKWLNIILSATNKKK